MAIARVLVAAVAAVASPSLAWAQTPSLKTICEGLVKAHGAPIVKMSEWVAAGTIDAVTPFPSKQVVPDHCLVRGALNARTGIDGKPYAIDYELRLPASWNGKFFFQGGGGSDGFLRTAFGALPGGGAPSNGLLLGYAVATTDAGHLDEPGPVGPYQFGLDPQARKDKGYNHIPVVHDWTKRLIGAAYGRAQSRSYFIGCSNGGRQGMAATQRYPDLFDGVIAGAPAYRVSYAAIEALSHNQLFAGVAPKFPDGKPDLGNALTSVDLKTISDGVAEACDAADGVKDGMVHNTRACKFDPAVLVCRPGQNSPCLTADKAKAVAQIYAGRKLANGQQIYSEWPWDPGLAHPGWTAWRLGTPGKNPPDARNVTLVPGSIAYYFATPPEPVADLLAYSLNFDFEKGTPAVDRVSPPFDEPGGQIENAASVEVSKFKERGGKILFFHGMADPIFSANDTMRYVDALAAKFGEAASFTRLYLVPGMGHCAGGPATDQFDLITALDDWVEKGVAPGAVIAKARQAPGVPWPGRARPLCPYPRQAFYKGAGDIESADNFECR